MGSVMAERLVWRDEHAEAEAIGRGYSSSKHEKAWKQAMRRWYAEVGGNNHPYKASLLAYLALFDLNEYQKRKNKRRAQQSMRKTQHSSPWAQPNTRSRTGCACNYSEYGVSLAEERVVLECGSLGARVVCRVPLILSSLLRCEKSGCSQGRCSQLCARSAWRSIHSTMSTPR